MRKLIFGTVAAASILVTAATAANAQVIATPFCWSGIGYLDFFGQLWCL